MPDFRNKHNDGGRRRLICYYVNLKMISALRFILYWEITWNLDSQLQLKSVEEGLCSPLSMKNKSITEDF